MGVLSWGGPVTPKFWAPPSGETMCQTPKSFRGARTCSRSSITVPSLVELGFHPPPGDQKRWVFCLSVCLSVCPSRFWTSEVVRPILPWRRWSTETILMPLARERFVVVHPCSTFSDCCQLATPLNAEIQIPRKSQKKDYEFITRHHIPWMSTRCWVISPFAIFWYFAQKLGFFANRGWQNKPIETKFGT